MRVRAWTAFGLFCLTAACGGNESTTPVAPTTPRDDEIPPMQATAQEEAEVLIVFLGDSLTAGYGLTEDEAFPALVEGHLIEQGKSVRAVNAGISGDTTAGGLARLDWLLRQEPDILVVALGANDGLRGVPLESSESNLRQILEKARDAGARVLLAGMLIPPNYGPDYTEQFATIYPSLAEEFEIPRIPFLLEGVAAKPELNLPDGIHPTAEGQRIVAQTVLRYLEPLVDQISPGPSDAADP